MGYLNNLRESGKTNMFGAVPYIMENYPELERPEARRLMELWIVNFNEKGDYENVKD